MAAPQKNLSREIHYPGEPWSVDQLEKIPHLHSVATSVREAISATNKYLRDVDFQNKLIYENHIALLNSDLLYRLKVTQQFHLLLQLFKDPGEKARWIQFLEEERAKERENYQKQQQDVPVLVKASTSNLPIYAESNHSMYLWTHPVPNLSNVEKWQHYEKELQRITFDYHVQRIHIRNNLLQTDTDCVDNLLILLRRTEPQDLRVIRELEVIKTDVEIRKQEIMNIPLYLPDGTFNLHAAKQQDEKMELLENEFSLRLDGIFNDLGDANKAIKELRLERTEKKEIDVEQLRLIDRVFQEQSSQLMIHIKAARAVTKQEVDERLKAIIQTIKSIDCSALDDEQNDQRVDAVKKLENLKEVLKNTEDFGQMRQLLVKSTNEIEKIITILPEESIRQLKVEANTLKKMVVTPSSLGVENIFQMDSRQNLDSMDISQNKAEQSHTSMHTSVADAKIQPKGEENSTFIDAQRDIKAALRRETGRECAAVTDALTSRNEVIDEAFNDALNNILAKINGEEMKQSFASDEQKTIQGIKDRIGDIKSSTDYEERIEELASIYDDLETLGGQCDRLRDIKEALDPVLELLETPSEDQNAINRPQI